MKPSQEKNPVLNPAKNVTADSTTVKKTMYELKGAAISGSVSVHCNCILAGRVMVAETLHCIV